MKFISSISCAALIGVLSCGAALMTWWLVGPPDRSVSCEEEELTSGYVCLKTVKSWGEGRCLWVDARPRKLWEKNGVSGSVLLTDDHMEDYDHLYHKFMNAVFNNGEIFPYVVIYCNEEGCGSSKAIAKQLRDEVAADLGFKVYVLHGGWKALAAERMTRS